MRCIDDGLRDHSQCGVWTMVYVIVLSVACGRFLRHRPQCGEYGMRVLVEVGGCVDDGLLHVSGGVCSMYTMGVRVEAVSYTHLTLPTRRTV